MTIYITCSKCKTSKDESYFQKDSSRPNGRTYHCRDCRRAWERKRNGTVGRDPNKRFDRKQYAKENQWRNTLHAAKRRAYKNKATPTWLSEDQLNAIATMYKEASALNMHVDHIVPLKNEDVCGLHVPWNLQLLHPTENLRKNNKFDGGWD